MGADQHYWHTNILKYCPNRPYSTIEEMNEALVRNHNEVVGPEDDYYCLGDFSFAFRSVEVYSHRLNGKNKYIIFGNHCPGHITNKHYKKAVKRGEPDYWKHKYEEYGWKVLPLQYQMELPEVGLVNLCHLPYKGTEENERYTDYRLEDNGLPLLHGHCHLGWKIKKTPKGTLMINVGVDQWDCKPVNIKTIINLIKENK
jgi:calcineurin-like phosphoesterase family protein